MNILFTSVGRRSYLLNFFRNALGGKGEIHAVNSSPLSPAFCAADHFATSPLIYDESYIPFLLSYCEEHKIDLIIPLFDIDLPILAKNREKFSDIGTTVLVSDKDFVEMCNDKWKTYAFLQSRGFDIPKTYLSLEDAKRALTAGEIDLPLVLKPRWGCGSISIYTAKDFDELDCLYKIAKRRVFETYLKYESLADEAHSVLIQEHISGQEFGADIFNDLNGKYINSAVKVKKSMRSGETDCAVTVYNEEISAICERLGNLTKHIANLDIDIFERNGKFYILEMNARFGGGYPFSHLAGADLPYAIIQWLKGKNVDPEILNVKPGVIGQKDINIIPLPKEVQI